MLLKLKLIIDFIDNTGLRYIAFRVWHMFQVKSGLFKSKFPSKVPFRKFISLESWRKANIPFFINSRDSLQLVRNDNDFLKSRFRESVNNNITFFNSQQLQLNKETQWSRNPNTGFDYDMSMHWSQIPDLSKKAGDIKFVWEKARFSYAYDIMRYDYHTGKDQAAFLLAEIEDFIDNNPINLGPQYKCSQEISLRILNWTYIIHYYKHSEVLTSDLFDKIMNSIYWQLDHVRKNIYFSRIAVRNNHAITESLTLYLSGLLFPFMPETKEWSSKGKKWFEEEIDYQIYDDGTFLQYSMNYHRVVIQLLTWAIKLAELNNESLDQVVYSKAQKSLDFLDACMDIESGTLPNYGSNDGALFFKFTDLDYRNYTSQLDDLRMVLSGKANYNSESYAWYGMRNPQIIEPVQYEIAQFHKGGYYIINEEKTKTFLRCGSYKDRPAQADNLHLDIWCKGVNYLWDCGSFKYNTDDKFLKHFNGTAGHNTVTVDGNDQMLKGGRFIWFKWVKMAHATLIKEVDYVFKGSISAFRQIGTVNHSRTVLKRPGKLEWQIVDILNKKETSVITQYWHVNPLIIKNVKITAVDNKGNILEPQLEEKWYSSYYGTKEKSICIAFSTYESGFNTCIKIIE